jgi:hypothetical protein
VTHLLAAMHRSNFRTAALALGALLALALWPIDNVAAAPTDDLRRALQRIDRQLCNKFDKVSCRRNAGKPKAQRKKQPSKKAVAQAAQKKIAAPSPSELTKKQDDKIPAEVASVPAANSKRPIPVLKPAKLKAKKKLAADAQQTASIEVAPGKIDLPEVPKKPPVKTAMLPKPVLKPPVFKPSVLKPQVSPPVLNVMPDDALSGDACIAALRKMKVDFVLQATPVVSGSCSVVEPVKVSSIGTGEGRVKLPDQPLLTCGFAARFASWLTEKGEPAVQSATGSRIQSMGTGPGFQCRGRNGDSSAKLSEHAFGNAVDIEYIKLANGQVIGIGDALNTGSKYHSVLATLRGAGCDYFTTVLGPGANAAHASHFHFDLERRGKKGNHKLCQ